MSNTTSEEIGLANNPLNICPHGLTDGNGDCDECRYEYEALESEYEEKLAREQREHDAAQRCALCRGFIPEECDGHTHDDPYEFEPFFEMAL